MYSIPVQVFTMANRTTYTKARATLASLCDTVAESREPYVIERRNGENVALISEAELNSLLETAHLLRSPRNAQRLAAALDGGGLAGADRNASWVACLCVLARNELPFDQEIAVQL